MAFLIIHIFLLSHNKTFLVGQPSTNHCEAGTGNECVNCDYRVWTETTKGEEQVHIKKRK
jgi:hypothetical protein